VRGGGVFRRDLDYVGYPHPQTHTRTTTITTSLLSYISHTHIIRGDRSRDLYLSLNVDLSGI